MKILACIGSYRTQGNTARLVSLLEEWLHAEAARIGEPLEFEAVYLGHLNLQMCRGCRICFDRGETRCPLKDDFLALKARIKAADVLVVASPVYVDDVSGITKNWIDRMAHACHRPEYAGKYTYLLATTGSSPTGHTLRTLSGLRYMGFHIIGQTGFKTGALSKREEIDSRYRHRIDQVAQSIVHAIRQQAALRPSFISLMTFKIQQLGWKNKKSDSIDYQYWQNNGWLDARRTFFMKQHAHGLKVALARLAGAVLAPFVIH